MTRSLKIPWQGNAHAVVVMEGELLEGFFEPLAATATGASGAVLRCSLPEGVRIPEWAIDTTHEPFELSKAKVAIALADPLNSPKRKSRAQLLDSVRRLESVRVSRDAVVPKGAARAGGARLRSCFGSRMRGPDRPGPASPHQLGAAAQAGLTSTCGTAQTAAVPAVPQRRAALETK